MMFKEFLLENRDDKSYVSYEVSEYIDITGTHFLGTVQLSYNEIEKKLGVPSFLSKDSNDDSKIEWWIQFEVKDSGYEQDHDLVHYTVATIYEPYDSIEEIDKDQKREWRIGGKNSEAYSLILELFDIE